MICSPPVLSVAMILPLSIQTLMPSSHSLYIVSPAPAKTPFDKNHTHLKNYKNEAKNAEIGTESYKKCH